MSLYQIQYDQEHYCVEEDSMSGAILLWQQHMVANQDPGDGWKGNEEPEQVVLISEEKVIRSQRTPEKRIEVLMPNPPFIVP